MPSTRSSAKTFSAVLEHSGNSLNWIIVRVPFDVAAVWGKRGQLRVKGEINGFAFATSLFPDGKGKHFLIANKKMQTGGRVAPGGKAKFLLEPDTAPRKVSQPPELLKALSQSRRLQKFYQSFNNSYRKWIADWVGEAKNPATRVRRAGQIAERLMLTMEAERELPPVLRVALAQNPKARAGWERMPPGHRRSHLMGIFYYRNPEAQARRVAKAVEEMIRYTNKSAGRNSSLPDES